MCGRRPRGNKIEPTGKFSPAARAATSATSMQPSIRARLRYTPQRCLNLQGRRPERRGRGSRKEGVVAEGNGSAQDETAGIREDPVSGIERNGSSVVVTLA